MKKKPESIIIFEMLKLNSTRGCFGIISELKRAGPWMKQDKQTNVEQLGVISINVPIELMLVKLGSYLSYLN